MENKPNDKLKIAFDVQGTLTVPSVRKYFHRCVELGHDVYIWSSSYSMARNMAVELNHPQSKVMRKVLKDSLDCTEDPGSYYMDLCIDDCLTTALAAKNYILVHSLHHLNNWEEFLKLAKSNGPVHVFDSSYF